MASAAPVARLVVVSGRVQGVSFRVYCARFATSLGLGGWVRNDPSGTVTAFVEGPPELVDRFVEWCGQGSPAADVTSVSVADAAPVGASSFTVRS